MRRSIKDHVGKKFGRLTVVGVSSERKHHVDCVCECGVKKSIRPNSLVAGVVVSCGCYNAEATRLRATIHGATSVSADANTKKVYRAWTHIKDRCLRPATKRYPRYGGRGIDMYAPWMGDFYLFYEHIGDPPTSKHTVDRIDNDLGYIPGNIRWATVKEQNNKHCKNVVITFNGETKTRTQWAEAIGIPANTLKYRLQAGWPLEEAMTKKPRYKTKDLT